MANDNVINMAEAAGNNQLISIEQMLEVCINDLRKKDFPRQPNKAIVILLNDEEGYYYHTSYQAKIKTSEIVALLDARKHYYIKKLAGE